jgi:hypothetical protein
LIPKRNPESQRTNREKQKSDDESNRERPATVGKCSHDESYANRTHR